MINSSTDLKIFIDAYRSERKFELKMDFEAYVSSENLIKKKEEMV